MHACLMFKITWNTNFILHYLFLKTKLHSKITVSHIKNISLLMGMLYKRKFSVENACIFIYSL